MLGAFVDEVFKPSSKSASKPELEPSTVLSFVNTSAAL